MAGILIKNGTLVTSNNAIRQDIAILDSLITATGALSPADFPGYQVMDASDKYILPGGIDPHVHLALPTAAGPSSDDFHSGSLAALAGGTTTIFDFVTPHRGQSLLEALRLRREEASQSKIPCYLHLGLSEWNDKVRRELIYCIENEGIRSVKCYLAYKDSIGVDYAALKEVMGTLSGRDVVLLVHCEDGEMIRSKQAEFLSAGQVRPAFHALSRPAEAEIRAISEVAEMAAKTRCRTYIVHISTRRGADILREAKAGGADIYGETCPHYLLLDDSLYDLHLPDATVLPFVLSPPIRSRRDQQGLWEAVADGTIDVVATDHCPFNLAGQKERGIHDFTKIPNGAGGIEHRLGLLFSYGVLTGRIGITRFAALVSANPAKIFGLGGQKGCLEPGYDADLVIWNPHSVSTISANHHRSRCDSDIFEGTRINGKPEKVFFQDKNKKIFIIFE